jgi:hypothetical protein
MKAPLYSISPGDLGIEPSFVQSRLREAFEIAETWNAVILLDEADVFLEKRDVNHLTRNQLVSGLYSLIPLCGRLKTDHRF